VRHRAALLSTLLAVAASTLALPGRADAVVPGFDVAITELPATFTAGGNARTVTMVAESEQNRCVKVRWSLILEADGVDLDDVRFARVEDDDDFPVRVQVDGDTARITDRQLDPGQLCRGQTVTARYQIEIDDEADSGRVAFRTQAFNAGGTLLAESTSSSEVVGQERESAEATPSPSESTAEPEETADDEQTAEPDPTETEDDIAAVPTSGSGTPSLLGPGLIVGGILVFLGVGLLLRLRMRSRDTKQTQLPTGFYPTR